MKPWRNPDDLRRIVNEGNGTKDKHGERVWKMYEEGGKEWWPWRPIDRFGYAVPSLSFVPYTEFVAAELIS